MKNNQSTATVFNQGTEAFVKHLQNGCDKQFHPAIERVVHTFRDALASEFYDRVRSNLLYRVDQELANKLDNDALLALVKIRDICTRSLKHGEIRNFDKDLILLQKCAENVGRIYSFNKTLLKI